MALTNEQITAQNFKDFYQQIRPYLNGNSPVCTNLFNKSDLYSTDEQLVGRWIDGKPLYQKVIHKTITHTGGRVWYDIADMTSSNIESIVEVTGVYSFNNFTEWLPISVPRYWNFSDSSAVYSFVQYSASTKKLRYCLSSSATETDDVVVIIKYTKTTDGSMSITDGNEYSLDEQVVGHWVDGKPIYQKTLIYSGSDVTMDNVARNLEIANISNLNIDKIIKPIEGEARWGTSRNPIPLSYYAPNLTVFADFIYNKDSGFLTFRYCRSNGTMVIGDISATLQYTKTTD